MTRKLAAIIAADVVGYSRLMGGDEAGTLAAHKTHRPELIDPKIAEREGRIVRTTGDGLLIEFPSVVEAVPRRRYLLAMASTLRPGSKGWPKPAGSAEAKACD
jgi:class 3 adenylate cyclase